jgi:hypothetical protein
MPGVQTVIPSESRPRPIVVVVVISVLVVMIFVEPWNMIPQGAFFKERASLIELSADQATGNGAYESGLSSKAVAKLNTTKFRPPAMVDMLQEMKGDTPTGNESSSSAESLEFAKFVRLLALPDEEAMAPKPLKTLLELMEKRSDWQLESAADKIAVGAEVKAPEGEGAAPEPVKDSSPSTAPSSKKKTLPKMSQEQLDRIKASRIEPMGHVNPPLSADDQFFNTIAPYVHDSQVDAQPMFVDFGCTIGRRLAEKNPNSFVLCMWPGNFPKSSSGRKAAGAARGVQTPAPLDDGSINATVVNRSSISSSKPTLSQHINLIDFQFKSFAKAPFLHFYRTCNMISTAVIRPAAVRGSTSADGTSEVQPGQTPAPSATRKSGSSTFRCTDFRTIVQSTIKMAKSTFVEVPLKCVKSVYEAINELGQKSTIRVDRLGYWTPKSSAERAAARSEPQEGSPAAASSSSSSRTSLIIRVTLVRHERYECTKIWGKSYDGGLRRTAIWYDSGATTIKIYDIHNEKKHKLLRTIHPLQYIVCMTLDTILSMGVTRVVAERLWGQMLSIPYYSDPLPHNWILVGGGVVQRIDKYDPVYDKKRPEMQQYWSKATRGYLHLLGFHLCLPINVTLGLPAIVDHPSCRRSCFKCAKTCSYVPKGRSACAYCVDCGKCVTSVALVTRASDPASLVPVLPSSSTRRPQSEDTQAVPSTAAPGATDGSNSQGDEESEEDRALAKGGGVKGVRGGGSWVKDPFSIRICRYQGLYRKGTGYWTEGPKHWRRWEALDKAHPLPDV